MEQTNKSILCIDDNDDTCELVEFVFKRIEYPVTACNAAEDGLHYARKKSFGAIILDSRFAETSGVKICEEIRSFDKTTPIVFFSAEARPQEIEKALKAGANAYLVKPEEFEKLTPTVIKLIEETGRKFMTAE